MSFIIFNNTIIPSDAACIKHNDRSFMLGHGFFETLIINNGAIPALNYHWDRLETSASLIDISIPFSKQKLIEMLSSLIKKNRLEKKIAGARLTISHGESARGILPSTPPQSNFIISVFEYAPVQKKEYKAFIVTTRKNALSISSRIKSTSYLDNILAKQEAISQGYDEAILLNSSSKVADGATTNVFMVKANQIYTPLITDGALPGVIRAILLKELKTEFPILEKSISPEELFTADEVFLTNALIGVQPLSQLNNTNYFNSTVANVLKQRLKEVKNYI